MVRSHMPGSVAKRTCSRPSNTRLSYWVYYEGRVERAMGRITPSDMTMRLCSSAICAICLSSAREKIFLTRLCGELSTIIFVRGLTALLYMSSAHTA